jgi:hypothetical protein
LRGRLHTRLAHDHPHRLLQSGACIYRILFYSMNVLGTQWHVLWNEVRTIGTSHGRYENKVYICKSANSSFTAVILSTLSLTSLQTSSRPNSIITLEASVCLDDIGSASLPEGHCKHLSLAESTCVCINAVLSSPCFSRCC